jgi:hypothetical protein
MRKSLLLTAALLLGACNGVSSVEPTEHDSEIVPLQACEPPAVEQGGICVQPRDDPKELND